MYVPVHFAAGDLDKIAVFVDRVGAADLVSFDGTNLIASLLPMIWERSSSEHGRLLGHMALANPQWSTTVPEVPALAIVHGPQAYISPSWYPSTAEHGRQVPTWNYTAVHFTGPVTFHRETDWLRDLVTRLTERHEHDRPGRWWVGDAPAKYIEGQLRAIVGIELTVQQIEAKDKLSQNRDPADQAGAIAGLRAEQDPGAHAIAGLMQALAQAEPD